MPAVLRVMDLITTHLVYLKAMWAYLERGRSSRGSYIILDQGGALPSDMLGDEWHFKPFDGSLMDEICEIGLDKNMKPHVELRKVRLIPTEESWFEKSRKNTVKAK